ncbi:NAD(P)-dependent oxidoreductase [Acidisoma cellulosilytica]|uniref:NAD(P)-dependent oxidoreductase n=1 Tax=Acidisoma cellulosilyticum TaxID=2802395 RepID=A0A963Z224_9PROT|nr:NAD(P)-dependent oxidoreductase [Acidisoma cellulosilyticum]MCB8881413.1 NAD(P)-dependent oxidoreductase [Acidisoma cellulosilyticum]
MSDHARTARPVIVTGAAGFIGHAVSHTLLARGTRVIGTDIVRPAGEMPQNFRFVQADTRDSLRHTALLQEGCDGIIHCGGISGPMLAQDNPAELYDINIRGTWQLLDLARQFALRRFVLCSSVSAYGSADPTAVIREDETLRASTPYGSSKAAADIVLQTYAMQHGLSATSLRLGWVYGPGRRTDAILRPMIRSAFGGPAFHLPAGGDHALQFVHVNDVADAIIAAFDCDAPASTRYNVNGAAVLSLRDIAARITQFLPDARIDIGPGMLPETDIQGPMSLQAALRDFGWQPRIDFDRGLRSYAAWLRDNSF